MDEVMSFRKIVKPADLNPSNRLFGGQMMKWLDEAAAIYATCQLGTHNLVTLMVSQLIFKNPAYQGDIVEFFCETKSIGTSSFKVQVTAKAKDITGGESRDIVTAELVFVTINSEGKPTPHNLGKE